jgi:sodium/proline symporter
MLVAILIGVIGYGVSAAGKIPFLTTSSDSETVVVRLADLLSRNGVLAALVAGVVLAGVLACTMSTADSQLLTAASSVSQDLLQHVFHVKLKEKTAMAVARGTVIAIALVSVGLAWDPASSVFKIVSFAWAGFGAAFGPVVLFALFWKRSNRWGALAGMLTGGVMVFVWKYGVSRLGGAWAIYELLPAFLAACVAIVVVSLLTPPPEQSVRDTFERVQNRAKAE